jgi:hypothetical protein
MTAHLTAAELATPVIALEGQGRAGPCAADRPGSLQAGGSPAVEPLLPTCGT